jgi:uracil phosphoribosyltransferase
MVEKSPDTLMASWMTPDTTNGIIGRYIIRCNQTNSQTSIMLLDPLIVTGNTTFSTTLSSLTAFTDYECTISASTGAGEGNSSDPQNATTDEAGKLTHEQDL